MSKAKVIKKGGAEVVSTTDANKKKTPLASSAAAKTPMDYSASENFEEGQIIYHKIWDDVGEVIEVGVTEDGIKKMKVNFSKVGLKALCMGYLPR